jgi:aminopeptidase N
VDIAEITRSETAERARLLRIDSYDVELDLTRSERTFRSRTLIRFDCAEPGAVSYADLVADTVHEITLNGAPVDPEAAWADGRIALTRLAARNELVVVADCAFSSDGTGLHRAVDSADGRVYCYTNFEPANARKVYANFEQPDLKASFAFRVTAPAHWTVLSNQPTPDARPGAEGSAVWEFPPTPRISTYLTAVMAGEYHVVRDSHTTPSGQVIPIGLACRQSLAKHLEPDDMFALTAAGLDYYTGLFDTPFPFEKYDQVFVPEFAAGAMENPGCVTWTESSLFRSRVTESSYANRARRLLHEMAHMWFGDMVTMAWWDDLWLNESFAEFCSFLACAEATRFTDAWTMFCASRKIWAYRQDQQPSTHPIAADVPTLTAAIANFDGISYAKGASVLKQLVAYTGRGAFFAGVHAYLAEHAWGNATLAELLAALAATSGRDLASWSALWLETAGPNTLRPEVGIDADGRLAEFAVLQEAPPEHPVLRPHHIAIGLYQRTGAPGAEEALVRTHRVEIDVSGSRTTVPELAGIAQPDLILLNDEDLGYAITRFDARSLRTLMSSIGAIADPLARAVCWAAVLDMAIQGELSPEALVGLVTTGAPAEVTISVLDSLLDLTPGLLLQQAAPDWLATGQEQIADVAAAQLRAAEPGGDRQLAWTQLLARTAASTAQLDLVAGLLDGTVGVPGLAVDTELRWSLLRRLAITGRAGDAQIDAELARDATDTGRHRALGCRAAIPDAEHKAAAWQLLTESAELGTDTVMDVGQGFNRAEHAALLAPYTQRYFEVLPKLWASRGHGLRLVLGTLLFPYPAASPELLARADEFLATPGLDPGLARVVIEGRDMAAKALRARSLR